MSSNSSELPTNTVDTLKLKIKADRIVDCIIFSQRMSKSWKFPSFILEDEQLLSEYFQPAQEEFLSLTFDERRQIVEWYEQLGQEIVPLYDGEFAEDALHGSPNRCNMVTLHEQDAILYGQVVRDFMRKVFAATVSEEDKERVELMFLSDPKLLQSTIEANTKRSR
ncbi:hypothetical protein C9374_002401 [Naegleria lovaniensis]|uniref:Uncharacterized protein n=1 Tax=Naegleria lovaniensis TaxID=51637 RepID=A0AA88GTB2_NAELO|nr:uncharacterized protein C9374_002401 [Naegleria lovaniensis]KAG2386657.1 hypothetical protein C9374_002401 [Naegleria lovaniensis]